MHQDKYNSNYSSNDGIRNNAASSNKDFKVMITTAIVILFTLAGYGYGKKVGYRKGLAHGIQGKIINFMKKAKKEDDEA